MALSAKTLTRSLAYEDQCTTANPVEPLVSQLKELLERCYEGTGVETEE